ncbi:hypothetical protein ABBQ38_006904 [Trebouxia sp. C0009 RCD-2024]
MGGRKGLTAAVEGVVPRSTPETDSKTTKKRKATHDPDQSNSETNASPQSLKGSKPAVQQDSTNDYSGPYPQLVRPTAQECQAARDGLAALHGSPKRAALGEEKFELAKQQAGLHHFVSKHNRHQQR